MLRQKANNILLPIRSGAIRKEIVWVGLTGMINSRFSALVTLIVAYSSCVSYYC